MGTQQKPGNRNEMKSEALPLALLAVFRHGADFELTFKPSRHRLLKHDRSNGLSKAQTHILCKLSLRAKGA